MKENLINKATISDVNFITNTLFDALGIILIVLMIVILVKLYCKIVKLIEENTIT